MAGAVNIPVGVTITDLISGFKAGSQSVSQFTSEFKAQFNGLKGSTDAPAGAMRSLTRQFAAAKREINDTLAVGGKVSTDLANKYRLLKGAVDGVRGSFNAPVSNQSGSLLGTVTALSGGLLSVGAAFSAAKQGLSIASDFERLDASLKAVSTSDADYARSQAFLRGTSDQLGLSIETLESSYKGLKAATNNTVLQGKATEQIFTSVVHAGAALKLSNDDIRGSLLALTQMMSKGTVSAEELRGQLGERLPGAFRLMAQGLGVTEQKLGKMLQAGEILATDALPKLATQLEKTYGAQAQSNVESMAGGWTRATDQLKLYIAEFTHTSGIDSFFTKIGNGFANVISGASELRRQGAGGGLLDLTIGGPLNLRKNVLAEQAAGIRSEFGTLDQGKQLARLQLLEEQIKTTGDLMQKVIFTPLLKDLKKAYQDTRRSDRAQAGATTATSIGAGGFDLEKAKDRQSALAKQIANATINGGPVRALQADYDKLTAQIERATASTKKHTAANVQTQSSLTTNERLLNQYTLKLKELGDSAPDSLRTTVGALQQLVADEKRAVQGAVDLGTKLKEISTYSKLRSTLENFINPFTNLPGLGNRFSEVGRYGSLNFYNDQIEKIKSSLSTFSLKNLKVPQETMDTLAKYIGIVNKTNKDASDKEGLAAIRADNLAGGEAPNVVAVQKMMDQIKGAKDAIYLGTEEVKTIMQSSREQLAQAGADLLGGIGESIGKGQNPLKAALKTILDTLGGYLIQLGSALLLSSAALLAAAPFSLGITLAPGLGQKIAGAGLILGGGAVKGLAATAFKDGGIVSGPTYSLTGEYSGAKNNPEVIAPLDKLTKLIHPRGSGSQVYIPDIQLEGSMIRIALMREEEMNSRYR